MRAILACAVLLLTACSTRPYPRLVVLGVDGMDPGFVARHWADLPNLRHLRDQGGFSKLRTTTPPQSPVAWSTFSTGLDPVQHGLFDFVHRDPSTMQPMSSFAETLPPAHQLAIGPYLLPLSRAQVRSFRTGPTFWELLSAHGIPATVIHMPANYPPVAHAGEQLAGMGTPDLEGTFGTFTYYSDDPLDIARAVPGGRIVPVTASNGRVILPIHGPPDTLRRDTAPTRLDLIGDIDVQAAAARFTIAGQQFVMKQGEWSPWIRVRFPLIDPIASVSAMFRIYTKQLSGGIRIYRTPLNIDPADPALPLSNPASYSRDLARRIGAFYTQGIAEDTAALRQSVFTLPDYLEQSRLVQSEHDALLRDTLSRYRDGLLFFYFSQVDQNSHVLWGRHEAELLTTYQHADRAIGEVIAQTPDAGIMVMSDHGFASFDHAFNLNTWLRREGFLAMTGNAIDWAHTRAYAMGLNALYVNLAGREQHGIVHDGAERDALIGEVTRRLLAEKPAIESISPVPPNHNRFAPDLIVGYAPGYRASWETALGEAPPDIITANDDAWIADHCIAADAVPGILVSNRKTSVADPQLEDLTVTILKAFGVPPTPDMKGRAIY
jgi:predicted AlkP superfamily phosphohydrolase/phosphomutase